MCLDVQLESRLRALPTLELNNFAQSTASVCAALNALISTFPEISADPSTPLEPQQCTRDYAGALVAAAAELLPQKQGDQRCTAAYIAAAQAITPMQGSPLDAPVRTRLAAVTAAALAAWRKLPGSVSELVRPLMAGLRHVPEPSLHSEVRVHSCTARSCGTEPRLRHFVAECLNTEASFPTSHPLQPGGTKSSNRQLAWRSLCVLSATASADVLGLRSNAARQEVACDHEPQVLKQDDIFMPRNALAVSSRRTSIPVQARAQPCARPRRGVRQA